MVELFMQLANCITATATGHRHHTSLSAVDWHPIRRMSVTDLTLDYT